MRFCMDKMRVRRLKAAELVRLTKTLPAGLVAFKRSCPRMASSSDQSRRGVSTRRISTSAPSKNLPTTTESQFIMYTLRAQYKHFGTPVLI